MLCKIIFTIPPKPTPAKWLTLKAFIYVPPREPLVEHGSHCENNRQTYTREPGIPLTEVVTGEGSNPGYIANEGQSCFHCKTHLYSSLEAVAKRAGAESRGEEEGSAATAAAASGLEAAAEMGSSGGSSRRRKVVLFNGTNKDDKRDPTRCGSDLVLRFFLRGFRAR